MGTGTSEVEIIPITEGPEDRRWFIEIITERYPKSRPKPRIQQVDSTLRQIESIKACFDPLVVSFGPVHHGEERLESMENHKKVTARWFLSRCTKEDPANTDNIEKAKMDVYDKFVSDARRSSPENCYRDESLKKYNQAEFMKMMFLDGCFIIRFIDLVVNGSDLSEGGYLNQPLIMRDMFLLENQIPYKILTALMGLMNSSRTDESHVKRFFDIVVHPLREPPYCWNVVAVRLLCNFWECKIKHCLFLYCLFFCFVMACMIKLPKDDAEVIDPIYLLDFLRTKLVGAGDHKERTKEDEEDEDGAKEGQEDEDGANSFFVGGAFWHYYFRPVMELKEAGIELSRSHRKDWSKIEFKQGLLYSHLKLPQIVVDDATRARLLNLIAYEMCLDGLSDCTIATYIYFLDSLIYNADDVKKLRSKNVLFNRLGSDEEVVNLFKDLARNLTPNYGAYTHVMNGIRLHRERHFNHIRVWIGQLIRNHFTSPWTIISLIAAIFLILLALVQTIYSVLSYYKGR